MIDHIRNAAPYDLHLQNLSSRLFKPGVSQKRGLDALKAYITGEGWIFDKPLLATWNYWQTRQTESVALNAALEDLHEKKQNKGAPLALDAIVAAAYEQISDKDREALLLLGNEFDFYAIPEDSPYFVEDRKQSIVTIIRKMEDVKREEVSPRGILRYLLPRNENKYVEDGLFAFDDRGNADPENLEFELSHQNPNGDAEGTLDETEELDSLDPAVLAPLYAKGVAALLSEDKDTITQIGKNNSAQLRDTTYKKHIALALRAAHKHQTNFLPQAVKNYEESIHLTPDEEKNEPLYAFSVRALLDIYCNPHVPNHTTKLSALYANAKTAAISLDEQKIAGKIISFADVTTRAYRSARSPYDLQRLDPLLSLVEISGVREILTTAYTAMMRQALDDRNIDHSKHCSEKVSVLSGEIPFGDELRQGIHEKVLDVLALEYEFALLQYEVGAVQEAALALEKCKRRLRTNSVGAIHLLTAKVRLAQGENDATLASLEAAVNADFSDARYNARKVEALTPLIDLGCMYHRAGETTQAQKAFQLAVALDSESNPIGQQVNSKDYLEKAKIDYDEGRLTTGVQLIERIAIIAQYVPSARENIDISSVVQMGDGLILDGDESVEYIKYATRLYTAAATLEPTKAIEIAEHCHALAKSYTDKKGETSKQDYTIAQPLLETALALGESAAALALYCPQAPREDILNLLNSVGVVYKDGKETPKNLALAKQAFTRALTLDSNGIDAHYHLGTIAMMEKDTTIAIEHLRTVTQQKPKHSWGQYQLGLAYQRAGNEALSQQHLSRAAELGHKQAQALLK